MKCRLSAGVHVLLAVVCAAPAAVAQAPAPVEDAVTTERLERMLQADDTALIVATFRRHPGEVLPFVDSYLEGGLKMIEDGKPAVEAMASFRTGLRFAKLATEATGDPIFEQYAASFASWSPQEQRNFRAGQQAYGEGRAAEKAGDISAALEHFTRSFNLANALNDEWGKAMASAGMARMQVAMGDDLQALQTGRQAATLYRRLQLIDSEVRLLLLLGDLLMEQNPKGGGLNDFHRAYRLLEHRPKADELRQEVLRAFVAALQASGRQRELDDLRRTEDIDAYLDDAAP